MDEIESLCRLCEAVETAGADIAPTYAEYVQLAFAIATDCGEAGREFFHRLPAAGMRAARRSSRARRTTATTAGSRMARSRRRATAIRRARRGAST